MNREEREKLSKLKELIKENSKAIQNFKEDLDKGI